MSQYIKLEVSRGKLRQSGFAVPPSGLLPRVQTVEEDPKKAQLFALSLFPEEAHAAVTTQPDGTQRVHAIYFPPPLSGWRLIKLLPYLLIWLLGVAAMLYVTYVINMPFEQAVIYTFIAGIVFLLLPGYPAYRAAKFFYFQRAPDMSEQRQVMENYPDIPVYHRFENFLFDTRSEM